MCFLSGQNPCTTEYQKLLFSISLGSAGTDTYKTKSFFSSKKRDNDNTRLGALRRGIIGGSSSGHPVPVAPCIRCLAPTITFSRPQRHLSFHAIRILLQLRASPSGREEKCRVGEGQTYLCFKFTPHTLLFVCANEHMKLV